MSAENLPSVDGVLAVVAPLVAGLFAILHDPKGPVGKYIFGTLISYCTLVLGLILLQNSAWRQEVNMGVCKMSGLSLAGFHLFAIFFMTFIMILISQKWTNIKRQNIAYSVLLAFSTALTVHVILFPELINKVY